MGAGMISMPEIITRAKQHGKKEILFCIKNTPRYNSRISRHALEPKVEQKSTNKYDFK